MSRSKHPQVLEIEPMHELRFKGPFIDVVTAHLKLRNPSDKRVCFKVKTTAPKRYCVRPNSGFVNAKDEVDVSVMLQPMDPDSQDKGKHKFMVQSMFASPGVDDIEKMWSEAQPADLMDSKLKCVFEEAGAEERPFGASQTAPVAAVFSGAAPAPNHELQSIMEECKRLQSENAKLKQLNDQFKGKPERNAELTAQHKKQVMLIILAAFVMGVLLGYMLL